MVEQVESLPMTHFVLVGALHDLFRGPANAVNHDRTSVVARQDGKLRSRVAGLSCSDSNHLSMEARVESVFVMPLTLVGSLRGLF